MAWCRLEKLGTRIWIGLLILSLVQGSVRVHAGGLKTFEEKVLETFSTENLKLYTDEITQGGWVTAYVLLASVAILQGFKVSGYLTPNHLLVTAAQKFKELREKAKNQAAIEDFAKDLITENGIHRKEFKKVMLRLLRHRRDFNRLLKELRTKVLSHKAPPEKKQRIEAIIKSFQMGQGLDKALDWLTTPEGAKFVASSKGKEWRLRFQELRAQTDETMKEALALHNEVINLYNQDQPQHEQVPPTRLAPPRMTAPGTFLVHQEGDKPPRSLGPRPMHREFEARCDLMLAEFSKRTSKAKRQAHRVLGYWHRNSDALKDMLGLGVSIAGVYGVKYLSKLSDGKGVDDQIAQREAQSQQRKQAEVRIQAKEKLKSFLDLSLLQLRDEEILNKFEDAVFQRLTADEADALNWESVRRKARQLIKHDEKASAALEEALYSVAALQGYSTSISELGPKLYSKDEGIQNTIGTSLLTRVYVKWFELMYAKAFSGDQIARVGELPGLIQKTVVEKVLKDLRALKDAPFQPVEPPVNQDGKGASAGPNDSAKAKPASVVPGKTEEAKAEFNSPTVAPIGPVSAVPFGESFNQIGSLPSLAGDDRGLIQIHQ